MSRSEQTLKRDYSLFLFIRQEASKLGSLSYNDDNEDNDDNSDNADNAETTSLDSKPWQYPDPPYMDSLVLFPRWSYPI